MFWKARAACSGIALLVAAGICLTAGASVLAAGAGGVGVTPSYGGRWAKFTVTFTAPDPSGITGVIDRRYTVSATGPLGKQRCTDAATKTPSRSRAHARVRVIFDPRSLGGAWCTGTFAGTVTEILSPVCPQGEICPEFAVLLRTIGHFKFHVRAPGADTTAPRFAGLLSATACTPGPQRPGQTTPFTLSWPAASDNVTPASKIVYDVFESSAPAAENFSHPTWSTAAGVTRYRTPGLPSHGSFYFVVRARDQAGNEDHNRVERHGSDPCL